MNKRRTNSPKCPDCQRSLKTYGYGAYLGDEYLGDMLLCANCGEFHILNDGVLFVTGYKPDDPNPQYHSLPDKCRFVVWQGRAPDGKVYQLKQPRGIILVPHSAVTEEIADGMKHFNYTLEFKPRESEVSA